MTDRQRTAAFAQGVFLIAMIFLGETMIADRVNPNPLSPIVWTVLGAVALGAVVVWIRAKWFGAPE